MSKSSGAISCNRHIRDSHRDSLPPRRSAYGVAGGVSSLSYFLLLILAPGLQASLCVPLGDAQPIRFSTVLTTEHDSSFSVPPDAWVLSDHKVYRLSEGGKIDVWPLQGQLQRDAFVVHKNSIFMGTTQGAMHFAPKESAVSLTFRDGGPGTPQITPPAVYFASAAFDTVLLSGMTNVYAIFNSGKDAVRVSLPPGQAYGHGPYWWVTRKGVYRLSADLSVSAPLSLEQPASVPVVVDDRLWFASQSYKLISISKDGDANVVPGIPGRVLNAVQGTAKEVWAATDQALKRIEVTATPNSPSQFLVTDEVKEGNIGRVLVLNDRLFYGRCKGCGDSSVLEKLLVNGHADETEARTVANGAGDFWIADAQAGVLYVPTETALIRYTFASRKADVFYNRSARFVFQWGLSLLLGSSLAEESIPQTAAGAPLPNSSGLGDRFANLCALEQDAQLWAKFSGAGSFDWYFEPFGKPILLGTTLLLTPMPPPKSSALPGPLQICTGTCKDGNWSPTASISAASGWAQTFDYTVRSQQTGDKSYPLPGRIFFISQGTFWSFLAGCASVLTGLVLVWLAGRGESPATVSARKFLFEIFPDSGALARVNLPVAVLTSLDAGLWWFLRPVFRRLSESEIVATDLEISVATATRKTGPDNTSVVVYDSLPAQAEQHSIAICKIIASEGGGLWRMPLVVRLNELNDGDVKKALLMQLQGFNLNNSMFADRIIRSRRMVYVFIGGDELKDKLPMAAVLQSARSQQSRSVIVTANPSQWEKSPLYKTFRGAEPPSAQNPL